MFSYNTKCVLEGTTTLAKECTMCMWSVLWHLISTS